MVHPNWFALHLKTRTGVFRSEHNWIENFSLPIERERGLPEMDAHLCIGEIQINLPPGQWSGFVASLDEDASPYVIEAMRRFRAHDAGVLALSSAVNPGLHSAPAWVHQLVLATDSFVFKRPLDDSPEGESVIAGYPWFGDWGRDTMIALPGLTLATGRYDSARDILETFARFIDQGMLPNVFPGDGAQPDYNTVDAALWYIEAWRAYVDATADQAALARVFPVLQDIIEWHCKGTRFCIALDTGDGLLRAGEPCVQLTWMDAKLGDWVVTPRIGKPVEVNALWFNALCVMAQFARRLKQRTKRYDSLAEQARVGFARFVRPDGLGLYDVLDGPVGDDSTVRPNQIFAVSLTHSALTADVQKRIVEQCARELLCSYGLRSLNAAHADYRPEYSGGVWERDSAYHQGPVWGWLLGHYALAEYRVTGDAELAQSRLEPVRDHLLDAGLGTVSEIFDGAPPHTPRGAPAQAWSVACVLEAWWRLERAKQAAAKQDRAVSAVV